ncbi:peptidoglycan-binding domain-containing protein [Streptomyces rectiverticillatus]|uniref:peptidoglycan-binding domain-containing protein n=1 Tax=Streptomyces rectiverticillatus TaxID=173860 RepID=UPI0015C357C1|nr:peptidoglycan-binding domain-containing protein [Streptomyces rectiverticillatus]
MTLAAALFAGATALTTGSAAAADLEGVQCQYDVRTTPPTVRLGAEGDTVREAQCLLGFWGFGPRFEDSESGETEGVFGAETEYAAKRFQEKRGLDPTGVVGPETWGQLRHS